MQYQGKEVKVVSGIEESLARRVDGEAGKIFLKEYFKQTDGLVVDYFQKKIEEARLVGQIPATIVSKFVNTVRAGKKIRGALLMLGYQLAGGKDQKACLDASLCLELFHAGVLVHDDIMDRDEMRRGLPSMHKQFEEYGKELGINIDTAHYGVSQAINLADAAYYMSWEILMGLPFKPEYRISAGKIYAEYVLRVVHGQVLDVSVLTNRELINEAHILNILKYKTAEYTGILPLIMGAALAGVDETTDSARLEAIKRYGLAFGWAFQIQDDLLGIYSDEEELGKPIGSDLREGKNTLLTLHVMQHGTKEQNDFQDSVLGNEHITRDDVLKMREIFKESGAYKHVYDLGWKYVNEGIKEIPNITKNKESARILESLIVYMMERAS